MVPEARGTFLSETWLTSDVIEAGIDIPGYSVFHSDRDGVHMEVLHFIM